ncbi:hypothetical protein AVEN_198102-1 [Araneus ventricosus]|uniref:Uncharacterized protein n=1 Tax=Araneus ventricosus TaxID=182803 RepID=A0A4Y2MF69_ARAVE|nr:hypothetical protein AVEN_220491-1 [Araneus ventricosus]GBN25273.1 hypothetical protein AVEN_198102-1 [Araneus ventricosus]
MDEFQCSWCRRRFYLKDGHFCFLEGKPDNEYSESFLDELEKLAERLVGATRNQDCISDDFGFSNTITQGHDIQLNSSLDSGRNFLTKNIFRGEQVNSSPASPFITMCHGSSLDVSLSDSHVSAQQSICEATDENPKNSLFEQNETLQDDICLADDNNSNPSEHFSSHKDSRWCNLRPVPQTKYKNTSFGDDTSTCRKKENRPSQFILGKKRSYFDSISASAACIESDGNKVEAQKAKDFKKIRDLSAKVTQIDDFTSSEIATNSVELGSVAYVKAVFVAGSSGIHTQSHRTAKEKCFACDVCGKVFGKKVICTSTKERRQARNPSYAQTVTNDSPTNAT